MFHRCLFGACIWLRLVWAVAFVSGMQISTQVCGHDQSDCDAMKAAALAKRTAAESALQAAGNEQYTAANYFNATASDYGDYCGCWGGDSCNCSASAALEVAWWALDASGEGCNQAQSKIDDADGYVSSGDAFYSCCDWDSAYSEYYLAEMYYESAESDAEEAEINAGIAYTGTTLAETIMLAEPDCQCDCCSAPP